MDEEITTEEETQIIELIAKQLYNYRMETTVITFLESLKPISRNGSNMGQLFLSPMLPFLGDNLMIEGDKATRVFEKDKNVEKLIVRLEELAVNGLDTEQEKKSEPEHQINKESPKEEKKGWRRFLPF